MRKKIWIKRVFLLLVSVWLMTLLVPCSPKVYNAENIDQLYQTDWIIGKNREEIQDRYGRFDREFVSEQGDILGAYYVNYENDVIDPSYFHDTYFVRFNEAGKAVEAYFKNTSAGG